MVLTSNLGSTQSSVLSPAGIAGITVQPSGMGSSLKSSTATLISSTLIFFSSPLNFAAYFSIYHINTSSEGKV